MAHRSLEYNQNVESRHQLGNRLLDSGDFDGATLALSAARQFCLEAYDTSDRVGLVHELIIRRDLASLDARQLVATVRPNTYLNLRQSLELDALSAGLETIYADLSDLTISYATKPAYRPYMHSETGMAAFWRGRIAIAGALLEASPGRRQASLVNAGSLLEQAEHHTLAGNNFYYKTLLFGSFARWCVLMGYDRKARLKATELSALRAAYKDPSNFGRALIAAIGFKRESTTCRVETSLRSDKM